MVILPPSARGPPWIASVQVKGRAAENGNPPAGAVPFTLTSIASLEGGQVIVLGCNRDAPSCFCCCLTSFCLMPHIANHLKPENCFR